MSKEIKKEDQSSPNSPAKAKLEYEQYLAEFKNKLQDQENHVECEISWKLSSRGIKSNRRILHIFHDYVFYYTKVPKTFKTSNFECLRNISPKAGVKLDVLYTTSSLKDDYSKKTKFLMMQFPTNRIIRFKRGNGNPLFDISKINMIEKNPVKLSEDSQSKWIFSTNPAINLQFFNGKNAEEIFLIKLSKLIQDELSPNGSEDEVVPEKSLNSEHQEKSDNRNSEEVKNDEDSDTNPDKNLDEEEKNSENSENDVKTEEIQKSNAEINRLSNDESKDPNEENHLSGHFSHQEIKDAIMVEKHNTQNISEKQQMMQTLHNQEGLNNKENDNRSKEMVKRANQHTPPKLSQIGNSKSFDIFGKFENESNHGKERFTTIEGRISIKNEKENSLKSSNSVSPISQKDRKIKKSIWKNFKEKLNTESPGDSKRHSRESSFENSTQTKLNKTRKSHIISKKNTEKTIIVATSPLEDLKTGDILSDKKKQDIRSKILASVTSKLEDESSEDYLNEYSQSKSKISASMSGMNLYKFEETIQDLKASLYRKKESNNRNYKKTEKDESIKKHGNYDEEKKNINKNGSNIYENNFKYSREENNYFSNKKNDENIYKNDEYYEDMDDKKSIPKQKSKNFEDLFYATLKENINNRFDYKKNLAYGLNLIEIMMEFQGFSQNIIKQIIDEFNLPYSERKFVPMIEKSDILIYNLSDEGLLVKLSGYKSSKIPDFSVNLKNLGNEFRANQFCLNKIIKYMKKNPKQTFFKVPLCTLIDYNGIRGLVYCKSDGIQGDKTLALGLDSHNIYQRHNLINDTIIASLSNLFHIKKHYVRISNESERVLEVALISSLEIHLALNTAKIEPDHLQDHIFYLLNAKNLLPDIYHENESLNYKRIHKYRPEFIEEYLINAHNPEWLISEPFKNEHHEASLFFKYYEENLQNFVALLEKKQNFFQNEQSQEKNSEFNCIETEKLADILHKKGLNLWSLGKLYQSFTHPYLKSMALNEMIIRTSKKLIRFHLSGLFSEGLPEDGDFLTKIKKNIIEFFNLIFCQKSKDSQIFWENVIWFQLERYYDIKLPSDVKTNHQLKRNYLSHLMQSLGLDGKNHNFSIIRTKGNFLLEDFKDIYINSKIKPISLSSIESFNLLTIPINQENEVFQNKLYRVLGLEDDFKLKFGWKFLKEGDFQQAIAKINELIPILPNQKEIQKLNILFHSYIGIKDPHNALEILNKIYEYLSLYFPNNHPFYLILLIKLCNFYMRENLEEETIFLNRKILNKFEKCLGFEGCFILGIYEYALKIFKKFNCINEKIDCLEKMHPFSKENPQIFVDLIKIYISKGEKSKADGVFKSLLLNFKEKKNEFSKENIRNLLELNDIFFKMGNENSAEACLKLLWSILKKSLLKSSDYSYCLIQFVSRVLYMIVEGFSVETKTILKEFLDYLNKKQENKEEFIRKIKVFIKDFSFEQFNDWLKQTLSRILLKEAIDEKNVDEEIVEGIFFVINRECLDHIFE